MPALKTAKAGPALEFHSFPSALSPFSESWGVFVATQPAWPG